MPVEILYILLVSVKALCPFDALDLWFLSFGRHELTRFVPFRPWIFEILVAEINSRVEDRNFHYFVPFSVPVAFFELEESVPRPIELIKGLWLCQVGAKQTFY